MSKHKPAPYPTSKEAASRAALGFSPIIEHQAVYPARPTYEDAISPNGMVCIAYDTTGMQVGARLGFSIAPWPVPGNNSQERVSSMGAKGDFSKAARAGPDQPIEGIIVQAVDADGYPSPLPAGWNGTLVPIVAGTTVWINFANAYSVPDGNARLQVNHS